jgi:hypothetical protein
MATSANLIASLKLRSGLQTSESFSDDNLSSIITEALRQHNQYLTIATLPVVEEEPVVILSWSKLSLMRASRFAAEASTSGASGYGSDKDSPFNKCLTLAKVLLETYKSLCEQLGIRTSGGSIVVSDLVVKDDRTDILVPYNEVSKPPLIVLALASGESLSQGTTYILEWVTDYYDDFYLFVLFHMTGSVPIYQQWNYSSTTGVEMIHDSATQVASFDNCDTRATKVTGVDKTLTNRFLLVCRGKALKYSYSNELVLSST